METSPESLLGQLRAVERHAVTSKQHDALKNARLILYFIQGRGESGEFTKFLNDSHTSLLSPVLTFATKEEADSWLSNHPAPPHGATIKAADACYQIAYSSQLSLRKFLRLPSEEEFALMEEGGDEAGDEAERVEKEPSLPEMGPGSEYKFFDFFKWTAFHLYEVEKRIRTPEELEALGATRIAFEFVMHIGEQYGFAEYWQTLQELKVSPSLQSFPNRAEAESWLDRQPEPPPPAAVAIGGELHSVGYSRLKQLRVMIRIPMPRELDG